MTKLRAPFAGLALAAVVAVPSLQAQSLEAARTTDFSVAAGVAFPQGDGMGELNPGFSGMGAVNIRPANMPVSFRVEALYTRLGTDSFVSEEEGGTVKARGNVSTLAGIGSVVLGIPTTSAIRPYLIGGLGVYRVTPSVKLSVDCGTECAAPGGSVTISDTRTKLGLGGGAGVEFRMGSLRSFMEARFHSVFTEGENVNFIPVTLGVRF